MSSDLEGRIRRIYAAIGEAITTDLSEFKAVTRRVRGSLYQTSVSFDGGMSSDQMQNTVFSAVHNVANLRDHLKKWARQNGRGGDVVDGVVEDSFELKVIIDLSNRDKHGGPDRGGGLSGLSPDLRNFQRGLVITPKPGSRSAEVAFDFFSGGSPVQSNDCARVVTSAETVDDSGHVVGDVMTFLEVGTSRWEQALATLGVVLEPPSA